MSYLSHYLSPLGPITLASDGEALVGLWFDGQHYFGSTLNGPCQETELELFRQTGEWLNLYFAGRIPTFTPPLKTTGSAFRKTILDILLTIPYGQTTSYGAIARTAARLTGQERTAPQAVGGTIGHNPIALIIPCHRVVAADGSLTGYAGGLDRKKQLLQLEHNTLRHNLTP